MISPVIWDDNPITNRSGPRVLVEAHIADIHFGSVDPEIEYNILEEQFLRKIEILPNLDILSINGDIFHHKFMANSPVVMYAIKFVGRCVEICKRVGATLVILNGTESHDAGQLKLFYHFLNDPMLDLRIVESTRFEYIKGAKILCITEEYGKGFDYYCKFLFESGPYDGVFMHGTVKGSVYGANTANLGSEKYPIFDMGSFAFCRGPIISGHVHTPGCFESYIYYCGSPLRFRFGEEEEKGFIILLHNIDERTHMTWFEPIKSFRYDTIEINDISMNDPSRLIDYLNNLQANGIDNIRVKFSNGINPANIDIIKKYYKDYGNITIVDPASQAKTVAVNTTNEILEKYAGMDFLLDSRIDEYEKFVRFINHNKGSEYITVDRLKEVLKGG